MSFVDRERASRLMAEAGLDALVIAEPEGFAYITGVSQGVPALFRRAGAGFAVLPADPQQPIGAVIGDLYEEAARRLVPEVRVHPLWMENADLTGMPEAGPVEARIASAWRKAGRPPGFARPATFDLHLALQALADLLASLGLAGGRLGLDLDYVAASDAAVIGDALDGAGIANGSPVLDRIRMVKTPGELSRLTLGVELAEAGLRAMAASVEAGHTAADLHGFFLAGVEAEAAQRNIKAPPSWAYIAVGPDPWNPKGRVEREAVIKADVGCVVDGYSSDTSRNYVFGAPTSDQAQLHRSIEAAFTAGREWIRPGVPLSEVHRAATAALEEAGLTGFSRGHFGHGLGHSLFSEQWPFIAATSTTPIEPGMVLAFEIPIYVTGVGGFNLEDQFLVTPDGHRSMNTLPHHLITVGR
ncbi:M24 family metallopeptidase [Labrys monachus]|uniref:Xaa-Pro aminopeptidase n=1 Tax=Labrys monachus TaxID=217067 RepID=A0ABU0F9R7_9HYPH|nr:Xaa-Pro peptidase family protein [Labrys monachus]MDQ0391361.1 Xaa-Pro aminopeptidase [Labrys monachus]